MFGGTKGKFNGLAFLGDTTNNGYANDPRRPPLPPKRRPLPPPRRRDEYYDEEEENFTDALDRISNQEAYYYDDNDVAPPQRLKRPNNYYYDDNDQDVVNNINEDRQVSDNKRFEPPNDGYLSELLLDTPVISHDKYYFITPPNDHPLPILEHNLRNTNRNGQNKNNNHDRQPNGVHHSNSPKQRKRRPRQSPWEADYTSQDETDDDDDDGITRYNDYYDDNDNNGNSYRPQRDNWAAQQVSNWFRNDQEGAADDEESYRGAPSGRQSRQQQRDPMRRKRRNSRSEQAPSLWDAFENVGKYFFRLDRNELKYRADMYNRQMGLGDNKMNTPPRVGRRRDQERRKGYAYHYEVDLSDYDTIVDADVVAVNEERETKASRNGDEIDGVINEDRAAATEATDDSEQQQQRQPAKKERSWEERALAMERIPPPGVPAWGPTGDLEMDAREKIIYDALQDIQEAQNNLEKKKRREQQALDDITILKV